MTKSDTMANTSMNVSLPEALKDYVQERVAEGTFSNPSDYVRALIREDRKRRAEERLDELLMEGINSGRADDAGGLGRHPRQPRGAHRPASARTGMSRVIRRPRARADIQEQAFRI